MGGGRIGQSLDPCGADLDEVTLDDAAGVEAARGHASAPLTDDGFREGFTLESDRLEDRPRRRIGGSRQARDPSGIQEMLLELRFRHAGAVGRRRGMFAQLLQSVADDIVLGRVASGDDLVVDEPLQFGG